MIDFNAYVTRTSGKHGPLVQPRMGVGPLEDMRDGLMATATANPATVCTITLDSFTRVCAFDKAAAALASGAHLNGFPIMAYPREAVRELVSEIASATGRPVQVRHGSALPSKVFQRMAEIGMTATEGGPVSYCLPYSRLPLEQAVDDWRQGARALAEASDISHIESFAGCMMGQMADPALLVALSVLEALFLKQCGVSSVSVSYAQGISPTQDRAALRALDVLTSHYLDGHPFHIVAYVFMGLFPNTMIGFCRITEDLLSIAQSENVARVIVKTPVENRRIPTVAENVASLNFSHHSMAQNTMPEHPFDNREFEAVLARADLLIEQTLRKDPDVGRALLAAFADGILDVPYCLHTSNRSRARTAIMDGRYAPAQSDGGSTDALLAALKFNQSQYDVQPSGFI
ncbi:hypothetical protein KUV51_18905 [Tateyamaria omphalii]|uniref:hypothetical protein n=1 Tax=Tateyamaria omphalii TaxID=299262 RepID=UPI001C98F7BE|nr:hypothetical protein [Tateyamaria omphalii]MBY5935082.1 hypothetical protein [Tateyamaria omphalii]